MLAIVVLELSYCRAGAGALFGGSEPLVGL